MASSRLASRVEVLVWVYVYGGLFIAGLGWALLRQSTDWGWWLVVAGAVSTLVGVVLVWWRSRMAEPRRDPLDPERKLP